jgi:predicted transcriptional regulator
MAYGMMASVEKTTVYIDAATKRSLEGLARRTGRPQAEILREALTQYIERRRTPALPTFVATVAVGGDASMDVRRLRADGQEKLARRARG